ncbi:MAG: flagellar biosynthetic protein FliO [Candidatus Gastranaerophilales bacterium]|nr:flagellar biosynthetic protein FliO [Candidatus Gastranaerophilales bacterium]
MIKKIFIFIIFTLFVFNFSSVAIAKQKELQPLKIEQNVEKPYKYGSFEKTFDNPALDNNKETTFADKLNSGRKEPSVLDVFNSLIFVIILILITGWIYMKVKRINPEQLLSGKFNKLSENNFKIVSSLQLGAGKSIYLIEINNKQLIVGTTSTNVNLLAQMDKAEDNKEIPKECIEKLFNDKTEEFKKLEE